MNPFQPQNAAIHEAHLRRLSVIVEQALERSMLTGVHATHFEKCEDYLRDALVCRLRAQVLGHESRGHETAVTMQHKVPATWWDHFKEEHEGRWFLRFAKPPKHRTITLTKMVRHLQRDTFPYCRIKFPKDMGPRVTIKSIETEPFYNDGE